MHGMLPCCTFQLKVLPKALSQHLLHVSVLLGLLLLRRALCVAKCGRYKAGGCWVEIKGPGIGVQRTLLLVLLPLARRHEALSCVMILPGVSHISLDLGYKPAQSVKCRHLGTLIGRWQLSRGTNLMVNVAEIPAALGAGRTCSEAATGGMSISSLVQERLLTHAAASVSGRERSRPLRQAVRANSDTQTVTLLDYGAGNVRSVRNAIKTLGYNLIDVRPSSQLQTALKYHQHSCFMSQSRQWHVTSRSPDAQVKSPSDITNAGKIIFPGVGAYAQAMKRLEDMDYVNALKEYIQVSCSLQRKLFRTMSSAGPNTRRIQLDIDCPAQQGHSAQI